MLRIMKALKLALVLLSVIFVIAGVLWYPYGSGVVPTWRIQIVDADGHPMAGIRVNQVGSYRRWNNQCGQSTNGYAGVCCVPEAISA
jgi:hypothetical protein